MADESFEVTIPDLGDAGDVRVVEVLVAAGDAVEEEQGLVTLESDKASMDVPSPHAGTVHEVRLEEGQEVAEGDVVVVLELAAEEDAGADGAAPEEEEPGEAEEVREEDAPEPARRRAPEGHADADLHAQVLVLGAGPGGYTAGFRAADLGCDVVLVERYPRLGGVCLNVGCIPSKALLHVARVIEEAADLAEHGVSFGEPGIELEKLRGFKDGVVRRMNRGLDGLAERRGVRVVEGTGRFASSHRLVVRGGDDAERTITFDHAIVAVGSRPVRLDGMPWDDPRLMDSTAALELGEIPERLLLVGGGIIGLEMAMVYGSLGSRLTVVEMLDGLIPGCDRDLVKPLARRLEKRFGAEIHLRTKVAGIEARDDGLHVTFEGDDDPGEQRFDRVLVAVGRRPNGDRIDAAAAGLEVDDRGFLRVDAQMRTNVRHIFAIGDVVGDPMLAHKASHEAKVAAEVAAGRKSAFDARVIPSVAYTDPEIAWVGLTETAAAEEGVAYEKGSFPWAASGRSLGMGRDDGLTKILFDPESRRILGAGVVGVGAGDLIAKLALAIEMDCEAADIGLTIHPHPTLSETVGFAAEAFEGTITDLFVPKRG